MNSPPDIYRSPRIEKNVTHLRRRSTFSAQKALMLQKLQEKELTEDVEFKLEEKYTTDRRFDNYIPLRIE